MNWIKPFNLGDWLWICFLIYKILLFRSIKLSCDSIMVTVNMSIQICHLFEHCMKSVQIRSYFWSAFSCIHSEYRKIQTRNNSVFWHFSSNGSLHNNRRSSLQLFCKICVSIFSRKHLCQSLLFYKSSCRPATSAYSY